jgi:hypothetical protein
MVPTGDWWMGAHCLDSIMLELPGANNAACSLCKALRCPGRAFPSWMLVDSTGTAVCGCSIERQIHRSVAPAGDGEERHVAAALTLRMLVTWLHDCPPAVTAFLSTPSHLPLLVDLVSGR